MNIMEKFIATPIDLNDHWIVERWNETTNQYERHLPVDDKLYYSKEEAESQAAYCKALAEEKNDSKMNVMSNCKNCTIIPQTKGSPLLKCKQNDGNPIFLKEVNMVLKRDGRNAVPNGECPFYDDQDRCPFYTR